jgi:kynurenine 3-monooxygenase
MAGAKKHPGKGYSVNAHSASGAGVSDVVGSGARSRNGFGLSEVLAGTPPSRVRRIAVSTGRGGGRTNRRSAIIVGAGLVGPVLGLFLVRRGYNVRIFDERPDPRLALSERGASISLTLTERGLAPLQSVGLARAVMHGIATPLVARVVHQHGGRLVAMPYGVDEDQVLWSVPRADLAEFLVTTAAAEPGIELHFGRRLVEIDRDAPTATFFDVETKHRKTVKADLIIGADGVHSLVRSSIHRGSFASFEKTYVPWRYKEITLVGAGAALLDPQGLHIWARGDRMMFTLPNRAGFNAVCVLPAAGPGSFDSLRTPEDVRALFRANFADVEPFMPHLLEEVLERPAQGFATVRTSSWHHDDKVVLIGDAAHAVIPFLGQGANAGFEDCLVFDRCLAENWHDQGAALEQFERERRPNTDALARLSLENFEELRDGVQKPMVAARRQVALGAYRLFGDAAAPLYPLMAHSTVPYAECVARAARRERRFRRMGSDLVAGGIVAYSAVQRSMRDAVRGFGMRS